MIILLDIKLYSNIAYGLLSTYVSLYPNPSQNSHYPPSLTLPLSLSMLAGTPPSLQTVTVLIAPFPPPKARFLVFLQLCPLYLLPKRRIFFSPPNSILFIIWQWIDAHMVRNLFLNIMIFLSTSFMLGIILKFWILEWSVLPNEIYSSNIL